MLRLVPAISLALALTGAASASVAQTFAPTGPVVPTGWLQYDGGHTCNITATATTSSSAVTFLTRDLPGSPLCGSLSWFRPNGAWNVQPQSLSTVLLTIGVTTVPGSCHGTIVANWNNATSVSFDNVLISPAAVCRYSGRIYLPPVKIL